jgi:hypothetical protein
MGKKLEKKLAGTTDKILREILKSLFRISLIFFAAILYVGEEPPYLLMLAALFIVLTFQTRPSSSVTGILYGFFYGIVLIPVTFYYFDENISILDVLFWSVLIIPAIYIGYVAGWLNNVSGKIKVAYKAVIETKEKVVHLESKVDELEIKVDKLLANQETGRFEELSRLHDLN